VVVSGMLKNDCLFCKIVKGEIPSSKIWEDKKHVAILDLFPNTPGMTVVMPKNHYDSYAFDMPDKNYLELLSAARTVSKLLDKKLKCPRTALVMEGMGVNHVHIKLYPMHGVDVKKFVIHPEKAFFDKYPGYITTLVGPIADRKELELLAKKIRGK
jgi:histidine triad (HIT) family protein